MCCEDVKIDYAKAGSLTLVDLTNSDQALIGANPHRDSLVVGQVTSGTAWIVPDETAVMGTGILVAQGNLPIVIDRKHYGSVVGKAWRVIHSAGSVTLAVFETEILPGGPCGDPHKPT